MVIPRDRFFYPTLTRIKDAFSCSPLFIYLFYNKLQEVPEYAKMQFNMMTLLDVLGKIAWVRLEFLFQGKISDVLIGCARKRVSLLVCIADIYISNS